MFLNFFTFEIKEIGLFGLINPFSKYFIPSF